MLVKLRSIMLLHCTLAVVGCVGSAARFSNPPRMIAAVSGLALPETAEYDSAGNAWFVSLMGVHPTDEDNDGVILRIAGGQLAQIDTFIAGGRGGITLHGPKGLAVVGDVLWVADINMLRAFNTKSGALERTVDLRPHDAVAVNDLAAHPDGSLYVTDLRLLFAADGAARHVGEDRIYRVLPDGSVSVAARGDAFAQPNGIAWDARRDRFVIASLASESVFSWRPGEAMPTAIATAGGLGDGIAVTRDGRVLFSSLKEGAIYEITGTRVRRVASGLELPANFGIDEGRRQMLIPLLRNGGLQLWRY